MKLFLSLPSPHNGEDTSLIFSLYYYARTCYSKYRILEVFAVYEATKTLDLCGLFYLSRPSRFESNDKEVIGKWNKEQ
jgi:hypothetical protein